MSCQRKLAVSCLGGALMLCSAQGRAQEAWITIPTDAPNITFAIDKSRIERSGPLVSFWERLVFSRPDRRDEGSGKLIREKRVQRQMHCENRTQTVIYGATYGDDGSFITSTSFDEGRREVAPIPPGTIAETEFRLLCAEPSGTFFGVDFER